MSRERYRCDLEFRTNVKDRILSLAEQIIAGRVGVIAAARELSRFEDDVRAVDPEIAAILTTFVGINSATDALPVGDERKFWSSDALEREDRKIAEAEN